MLYYITYHLTETRDNMITIQIRKHKNPFIRKYDAEEDKLMGDFTTVKEALKWYKTMGYGTQSHYFIIKEKGIPGILVTPTTRHFKAAGHTRAARGPVSENRGGGWKGGEV